MSLLPTKEYECTNKKEICIYILLSIVPDYDIIAHWLLSINRMTLQNKALKLCRLILTSGILIVFAVYSTLNLCVILLHPIVYLTWINIRLMVDDRLVYLTFWKNIMHQCKIVNMTTSNSLFYQIMVLLMVECSATNVIIYVAVVQWCPFPMTVIISHSPPLQSWCNAQLKLYSHHLGLFYHHPPLLFFHLVIFHGHQILGGINS
ncbi:hypothetical protein BC941DRAFT_24939 [Chlamydoabsidia padenii]|nr:hypothetical protein BC941DRAFT_24939 [Chlamydoabsidia padenii]